jgi:hypothetical protein
MVTSCTSSGVARNSHTQKSATPRSTRLRLSFINAAAQPSKMPIAMDAQVSQTVVHAPQACRS